ncbi:Protochlorophyllide-dependent translocon component 52 protein [Thalictrum thalictroides]|uniref:Protochlorophyllide-dependent translocon component 52 protein n=1 Tax=Thalictrum thalictroides TaxID=46969 RepID=A0A7J6XEF0_THATH|nr:Protochlorophyllide-dependent translocon component 52 protein [Thalictrum thalictroides]
MEISVQTLDINGYFAIQERGYSKFIPPCVFYAMPKFGSSNGTANGSASSEPIKEEQSEKQKRRMLLIFICVPVSPGNSRLIWAFPRNFGVLIDRVVPRWVFHIGQNLILDSDLYLLHLEEHKIVEAGPSNWQKACFVPTKSDALVVAFRKWLRRYSGGQIDWGTKFSGILPPSPPKEQLMDRYRSHVLNCSSCRVAVKGLKALEVALQVISIASIGIIASIKQGVMSMAAKTVVVSMAVLGFAASKWLSNFIYKNFYFHDYNHALRYITTKIKVKFNATSFSGSVSTEPEGMIIPNVENEGETEKFDWYSHWYPVMPLCDLDKRVPHAKKILGIDVVVWWDRNENKWQVFEDKCPHRLAPLSEGRIDEWGRLMYRSHVLNCSSCRMALKGLKALEVTLQVISASIGIAAAMKQNVMTMAAKVVMVSTAMLFFGASKWLSHFINKEFYFHDYNHALSKKKWISLFFITIASPSPSK